MHKVLACIFGPVGLLLLAFAVSAETPAGYAENWGPAKGQPLPLLGAPDQSGKTRTLDDLKGKQGLLLFMNRSADW